MRFGYLYLKKRIQRILPSDIQQVDTADDVDVWLQHNIKGKNYEEQVSIDTIRESRKPVIVFESPAFRQIGLRKGHGHYYRFSWNSYTRDDGEYNNKDCPPDRWNRIKKDLNIDIKDWRRSDDGYILFILQKPEDSSLMKIAWECGQYSAEKYFRYLDSVLREMRKYTDRKIRIRLHPIASCFIQQQLDLINRLQIDGLEISSNYDGVHTKQGWGGRGLYEDFAGAFAVVGMSSNTLTESVCEGIPTWSTCPSCMAWDVSNHDLSSIENDIVEFDRAQWLHNLAYTQWNKKEILSFKPINHLMKCYEEVKERYGWF